MTGSKTSSVRTSLSLRLYNFYTGLNGDHATATTLHNSFLTIGFETLTGGKRGFVNFTKNLLLSDVATLFPKDLIAVEVLEEVIPDEQLIDACKRLKKSGYLVVLDDFVLTDQTRPFLEWLMSPKSMCSKQRPLRVKPSFESLAV